MFNCGSFPLCLFLSHCLFFHISPSHSSSPSCSHLIHLSLLLFFCLFLHLFTPDPIFPHSSTEPLCNVDHEARALPANTQLTLGSVSHFFQGCTLSHIMSVYLFPHDFGGGGRGVIQTVCLPVQTRADAQGNMYSVTINREREKCKMSQKCQKLLIFLFFFLFFLNGTNVSLT